MATPNKAPEHRRKWDREEYEQLSRKRLAPESDEEDEKPVKRELLKQRDYKVDLESRVGKTIVVTKATPASQSGGYYCDVCVCVVKDSINFLDHINGKKHQRNKGMSMKIERSSVDQVKNRFELLKKKKEQEKKSYDFDKRIVELKEEEEKIKEYRREKRSEIKQKKKAEATSSAIFEGDDEMAKLMGFSGFGTSKK